MFPKDKFMSLGEFAAQNNMTLEFAQKVAASEGFPALSGYREPVIPRAAANNWMESKEGKLAVSRIRVRDLLKKRQKR